MLSGDLGKLLLIRRVINFVILNGAVIILCISRFSDICFFPSTTWRHSLISFARGGVYTREDYYVGYDM